MTSSMNPQSSRSFSPLSSLNLPGPHVLLPQSCNPSMDLVVLLTPVDSHAFQHPPSSAKGKGKEVNRSEWKATRVVLWRMMGSKVWEKETTGWVASLAWSRDGLFLSMAVINNNTRRLSIDHISVHTGELIKSVPVSVSEDIWQDSGVLQQSLLLNWSKSELGWEKAKDGTGMMIIDSLPLVTPVDPPKPAVLNPFAKPPPAPNPLLPHSRLSSFPSLLPATPPMPPDILNLSIGSDSWDFLTGSFPVGDAIGAQTLKLAQLSDKLAAFLNIMAKGLESVESAWREAFKQTMIWREELETCGQQHGMPVEDVHADLFRLLMIGRCREAVSDWLGSKLTGRTLSKWEQTLTTSFSTMQKVICESVGPASERIVILLDELNGWQRVEQGSFNYKVETIELEQASNVACELVKLIERVRWDVQHESLAAASFMQWLKYEISRAGAGGDEPPSAIHDLKLTWAFMTNGFVKSILSTYFADTMSRPTDDTLASDAVASLGKQQPMRPLKDVIQETLSGLKDPSSGSGTHNPDQDTDPEKSSMLMSSPDPSKSVDESRMDMTMDLDDQSAVIEEEMDDSSSTTSILGVEKGEVSLETPRKPELEPWVWLNTLTRECRGLVTLSHKPVRQNSDWDTLVRGKRCWSSDDARWIADISESSPSVMLHRNTLEGPSNVRSIQLDLRDLECLAAEFFDDQELVFLLQDDQQEWYLATTVYPDYFASGTTLQISSAPLVISRSRHLSTITRGINSGDLAGLAVNGSKGRRVGCVLLEDGSEVRVWDMDIDEDEQERDEEGGPDGMLEGPEDG